MEIHSTSEMSIPLETGVIQIQVETGPLMEDGRQIRIALYDLAGNQVSDSRTGWELEILPLDGEDCSEVVVGGIPSGESVEFGVESWSTVEHANRIHSNSNMAGEFIGRVRNTDTQGEQILGATLLVKTYLVTQNGGGGHLVSPVSVVIDFMEGG